MGNISTAFGEVKALVKERELADKDFLENPEHRECQICFNVSLCRTVCQCDPSVAVLVPSSHSRELCTVCNRITCLHCNIQKKGDIATKKRKQNALIKEAKLHK